MRLATKLLVGGSALAGTVLLARHLQRRRSPAHDVDDALGADVVTEVVFIPIVEDAVLVDAGISDVDPEPLLNLGEATDPDSIEAALHSVIEQREKLPR